MCDTHPMHSGETTPTACAAMLDLCDGCMDEHIKRCNTCAAWFLG